LKDYKVGLFYYAGHGLQIEGKNYLTATDTSFADSISAKRYSICLDEVIERMQIYPLDVKILILDTCRDNPLPTSRGVTNIGLAPIHAPKGTLIAFSTSPGEKARDSGAGRNSIYTGAFLKHIDDANIPIEEFFKRVRTSVFTHSKGQQTSWEHTSLIGDFFFNDGQLVHSSALPYKKDYVADGDFISTGTPFDEIISEMRSHEWPRQQAAIRSFNKLQPASLDASALFLAGRNILQMAEGGEFSTQRLMEDLDRYLSKYVSQDENHMLNGMLYEIYFNSKGQFRQSNFKNSYVQKIFQLQKNSKYKKSFDFICKQLRPYKEHIFYMPEIPAKTFPVEVGVVKASDGGETYWKVTSIKHNNIDLYHQLDPYEHVKPKDEFVNTLVSLLTVPLEQLTLTYSEPVKETDLIAVPFDMRLSRVAPTEVAYCILN